MTETSLTKREAEVLNFILVCIHKMGFPPTSTEIGHAIFAKSASTPYHILERLHSKGYIHRYNQARAITVLKDVEGRSVRVSVTQANEVVG